jgi:hypothetical protein
VVNVQLRRDRTDAPMFGVIQAHDFGFERARDHRNRSGSRSTAQPTKTGELR